MKKFKVPVIAVPHQLPPVIWRNRPADDPYSDGHDLHALLEDRQEAEAWVRLKQHGWIGVSLLIDRAWPCVNGDKEEEGVV